MGSMPVHHTIAFVQGDSDEATTAWAGTALPGLRLVQGAVGGADQPVACAVEKSIRLVVHLHRHMAASIQVGVCHALVTNRESAASLTLVPDVESDGLAAIQQRFTVAQGVHCLFV